MTKLADYKHGRILYLENDVSVGRSIEVLGEYSEPEVELFSTIVRPGDIVFEPGANIGAHTVPLAKMVGPSGRVVAYEPQPRLFACLCGTLALNDLWQVTPIRAAVGSQVGTTKLPWIDYGQAWNLGGAAMAISPTFHLNPTKEMGDQVNLTTIDTLHAPHARLIKADVEGMECQVLLGAADTIERCRPYLYCECEYRPSAQALINLMHSWDYAIYLSQTPVWFHDRYCWSVNLLGVPDKSEWDLQLVTSAADLPDIIMEE